METGEKALNQYRQRLRILLDQTGIRLPESITDDWVLNKIEQVVYDLAKSGGLLRIEKKISAEQAREIEEKLVREFPDKLIKHDEVLPKRREFVAFFNFLSWFHWSLGFHVDLRHPHIEIHVPFGFFRLGWWRNRTVKEIESERAKLFGKDANYYTKNFLLKKPR